MPDYGGVGCEDYRELLSARLDGEDAQGEGAAVDAHLAECAACRRWADDAAAVTRLVRTGPAAAGADVTDAVLAAAPGRGQARVAMALRFVLGAIGIAQLALGLTQAMTFAAAEEHFHHTTVTNGASLGHLWHESAAWNVAVGAAFLWVAARRGRPAGILPLLTAFVGVLALLSAGDILAGRVETVRLASHAFILTGYLLVLALSRPSLTVDDPPGGRRGIRSRWRARVDDPPPARPLRLLPAPEARQRDAA